MELTDGTSHHPTLYVLLLLYYQPYLNIFQMHDLSEGVIPAIFELIITTIVTTCQLDPSSRRGIQGDNKLIIINCIDNFDFYEGKPSLKWVTVSGKSGFKISGTALQVCTLIVF